MFEVPEKHRIGKGALGSDESYGNNGAFVFRRYELKSYTKFIYCIASDGYGWEHVSVSIRRKNAKGAYEPSSIMPEWRDMRKVKDMFWGDDDVVMQLHPAKKNYVNIHPHVLHLWRPVLEKIPMPPMECV